MKAAFLAIAVLAFTPFAHADQKADNDLFTAIWNMDPAGVNAALKEGANPNAMPADNTPGLGGHCVSCSALVTDLVTLKSDPKWNQGARDSIAKSLLAAGAQPSADAAYALLDSRNGQTSCEIFDKVVSPETIGTDGWIWFIYEITDAEVSEPGCTDLRIATALVRAGANPNAPFSADVDLRYANSGDVYTPLFRIASDTSGNYTKLSSLIQVGANPNYVTQSGVTALTALLGSFYITECSPGYDDPKTCAQEANSIYQSVQLLLAQGNSLTASYTGTQSKQKVTLLQTFLASAAASTSEWMSDSRYSSQFTDSQEAFYNILNLFAQAQVDPSIDDASGQTLAHEFVGAYGLDKTMLVLQKMGVDLNKQDVNGQTVLHLAVLKGNYPLCKYLLGMPGFRADLQDKNGKTAEDLIQTLNDMETRGKLEAVFSGN